MSNISLMLVSRQGKCRRGFLLSITESVKGQERVRERERERVRESERERERERERKREREREQEREREKRESYGLRSRTDGKRLREIHTDIVRRRQRDTYGYSQTEKERYIRI